jgi:hypothetical protein
VDGIWWRRGASSQLLGRRHGETLVVGGRWSGLLSLGDTATQGDDCAGEVKLGGCRI